MNLDQQVIIFKALADRNRLSILKILTEDELCACHILEELDITQPTLSHHMKILQEAGLVEGRKEGKWTHYRRTKQALKQLVEAI